MPYDRQNPDQGAMMPYTGNVITPGFTTQGMPTPTGIPTGPVYAGPQPAVPMPSMVPGAQIPTTVQSPLYTAGFLRTQIGKLMRVEFLIGSGALVDRTGVLEGVGSSYILLRQIVSNETMMCDLYSIKFVTIIR